MKLLIIEDDLTVAQSLVKGLQQQGHSIEHSPDGKEGLERAQKGHYDVLIVDRMLPSMDGLDIVRKLRQEQDETPVLLLSALGEVDQRVEGLTAGGDDYLTKPFAFPELLARLDALSRRKIETREVTELQVANLRIDLVKRQAYREQKKIHLQQREMRLLEYLMRHEGQIVTRNMLLENVWDYNFDPQTNVIDVHISRLRQKIDRDYEPKLIHTVRGAGYVLSADFVADS